MKYDTEILMHLRETLKKTRFEVIDSHYLDEKMTIEVVDLDVRQKYEIEITPVAQKVKV